MKLLFAVTLMLLAQSVYAAEPQVMSPDPYGGPDKRPEKSENVTTFMNEDGTSTTSAVMTYGDGHQEHCLIVVALAKDGQRHPKALSKTCTRIRAYFK